MYDSEAVTQFVDQFRSFTKVEQWLLLDRLTAANPREHTTFHDGLCDRFENMIAWEKANVLYKVSDDAAGYVRSIAKKYANEARENDRVSQ